MHILPWRRASSRHPVERDASAIATISDQLAPFAIHRLRTCDGGVLRSRKPDGAIVNEAPGFDAGSDELVLLRLPAFAELGFLVASGGRIRPIALEGDSLVAPVLSFVLVRFGADDQVALRNPLAERHLCAMPHGAPELAVRDDRDAPAGAVRLDREPIGAFEILRLEPVERADAWASWPVSLRTALLSLVGPLVGGLSASALAGWLEAASLEEIGLVGPALLRLARRSTLEEFAGILLQRPVLTDRLARGWPEPASLPRLLPALVAWNRMRETRAIVQVEPVWDEIAQGIVPGHPVPEIGRHLIGHVRAAIRPRSGPAIVATCRNEGAYLLDWIAHHRAIGFEHLFLYSNNNNDGSDALLAALAEQRVITWLPNPVAGPVPAQRRALSHAFLGLPDILDHRWVAVIDVDEFICLEPSRFATIGELLDLAQRRGADSIVLNWLVYTASGRVDCPDLPLAERMPRRRPSVDPHVKSIVRPGTVWASTCHAPIHQDGATWLTLDADGRPHHWPGKPFGESEFRHCSDPGPASIAHYHLKSFPEFVWKASRNRGNHDLQRDLQFRDGSFAGEFLRWFDHPDAIEDPRVLVHAPRAAEERARLLALPGVAGAHEATVAIFRQITARLLRELQTDASAVPEQHRAAFAELVEAALQA